ncbi:SpoIIIAH-like family protein [Xylanibacillus composti]|uniref:SpoIIIAH-like family protein n=1 Tax=Xylanibacillus composti TaxID=1572762 RepID=A0A8J4M4I4_9BACL|nr:SpoIIIAH-like family protein [Xylanibacillus composti]MDT9726285.1 SpoIIIAH-like family protein [Xylanibacillus composti]GIQ70686.1 hypothetical protein XYCOK13_35100 [Xylanibacillus composti]
MNTKRQTVWLVSMLSLMVVLSAYYLFTEDVDDLNTATNDVMNELVIEQSGEAGWLDEEFDWSEHGEETAAANDAEGLKSDEEILFEMQAQAVSGQAYFLAEQMERDGAMYEKLEKLTKLVESASGDALDQAVTELYALEDQMTKIQQLEAELQAEYENVLISEDGNKWKVSVQANDLQKGEVVSIAEHVMKELEVEPHDISIEMVQ